MKTFPLGGIHPPENKITAEKGIRPLEIPAQVSIPVNQHIGAPPKILVDRGAMVKTGQILAGSDGFISANIHASVSGKVIKIDKMIDVSGYRRLAMVIKVSEDEWEDGINRNAELDTEIRAGQQEIVRKVHEMGIVGLGGATFPSHVKLSIPRGKQVRKLLVNGAECEPYLTSDHALMLEKPEEIITGIRIMMKALDVEEAIIGIEINKRDAIETMQKAISSYRGIAVEALRVKYPQGGEKQLIKSILGREVPSGGLPVDVGCVVFNVGTLFATYEAIQKNKPLIERVVTVTGRNLKDPGNFMVRIGTPVSALIEAAGGLPDDTGKIIAGGPMMGKALNSLDIPVNKGTSGLLLLPEALSVRGKLQNCVRCSRCVTVCPMGLEPYLLERLAEREMFDRMEEERAMDCIECGSCSYICPANRALLDYIRLGKKGITRLKRERK